MKEFDLIKLGFEKDDELFEQQSYCYSLSIANLFDIQSCESDSLENGNWYVEILGSNPTIKIFDLYELKSLLKILRKNTVKTILI